jgi:HNH endonuclease
MPLIKTGRDMPCESCGTMVYVPPYRQRAFRACSNNCRARLASVGSVNKVCHQCGAAFSVERWRNRAKFCSPECYAKSREKPRVTVDCVVCGAQIDRLKIHLHKSGKNVCGPTCRGMLKRRVRPKGAGYARKWLKTRAPINECERCGYAQHPEILVVHHKDRNRGNNDPANFEVLCPNCHAVEHYVETVSISDAA